MAPTGYFAGPTPRVFGHRGAAALAPENTLPSFALALALGADALELDVHATRDGVIVVIHDDTLERTTNGQGAICDRTWSTLSQLDAGYRFTHDGRTYPFRGQGVRLPTLEAVLQRFPLACCNVEVKRDDPPIVEEVVRIVNRLNAEARVLLAAEHDAIMQHIRRHAGAIVTSFAAEEVADFLVRVQTSGFDGYRPLGRALQIPTHFGEIALITAETVAAAHRCGLEVHAWTINLREEMEALLALGVDGIMSDLPGLARVVVDAWTRVSRRG
ncbi:MAG: glycerophosphodiester phosphodiesterase [Candidatus Binatia bacterium]